jgi:hypothetical protein
MTTRPGHHAARVNKGHPRRQARRDRAAERLAGHVYGRGCGKNCPKRPTDTGRNE